MNLSVRTSTYTLFFLCCAPHIYTFHTNIFPSRIHSISRSYFGVGPPSIPPPRSPTSLFSSGAGENETKDEGQTRSNSEILDGDDNPLLKLWNSRSLETKEDIKQTAQSFAIACLIRIFLIEPRYIPSLSMYPTFDIGDQLLVDKISHFTRGYLRKDVVVFNPSETYIELTGNTEALIKRVVAVEGDTVEIKNNKLFVNGVQQEEPYINEDPDYSLEPVTVPVGMLLVLGDNRNHSFDSHVWGFLPTENVIGRAVCKYWPISRIGIVEGSS